MSPSSSCVAAKPKVRCRRMQLRRVKLIHKSAPLQQSLWLVQDTKLIPKEVTRVRLHGTTKYAYPICPGCGITMDRSFQHYCDRCGQKLTWNIYYHALHRHD